MRRNFRFIGMLLSVLAFAGFARAADIVTLKHTTARLVSENAQISPKGEFWVMFQLDIEKGWHTYWINPGDSGQAPQLAWTLPEGVTVSEIFWQPPHRQPFGPLMNYGYSDYAYHLVRITLPQDGLKQAELPLQVSAKWLVCEQECIPEAAQFSLTLPVADEAVPSVDAQKISSLVQSSLHETTQIESLSSDDGSITLRIPAQGLADISEVYFYPHAEGVIEPAAPQTFSREGNSISLVMKRGILDVPAALSGLLEVKDGQGIRHINVTTSSAQPGANLPVPAPVRAMLLLTLLSAFIGGIILNAMPCVFPVLSLKALAISRSAHMDRAHIKADGLAYAAGVITSFIAIGGLLLLLKAGGAVAGWGFQMQSPLFVTALVVLLFAIGLNLSGFYDITLSYGGGQSLAGRNDRVGSFFTGVLATVVATPCTAPFMATALGAALALPTLSALLVFAFLGLGLAFPYLLLTWFPAMLRVMPKPGAWMETFRQFLAFPMYAAALWLLWVLGNQTDTNTVAKVLLLLIALVFSIWLYRHTPRWPKLVRVLVATLVLLAAACPLVPLAGAVKTQTASRAPAFSTQAIADQLENGVPVFVYGTADWCITCKFNERVALQTEQVQSFIKEQGIHVIKADWTSSDPAITAWLDTFNRSGVPLYVYYPVQGKPVILPQILTPEIVVTNLSR